MMPRFPDIRVATMLALLASLTAFGRAAPAAESFQFGFARVNITPDQPLRLSGYGGRTEPFTEIDTQLWTRVIALKVGQASPSVLVTVDSIGLPGALVNSIAERAKTAFGIPRKQFVICFTHSHTTPHIAGCLTNLFAKPLTQDEAAKTGKYSDWLAVRVLEAVRSALEKMQPGALAFAEGEVTFAQNRRVLKDARWQGFGVNPGGPVDHALPVLRIVDAQQKVRAIVFNYACHCTTFGGNDNRVNGDWAGYATKYVEEMHPGAVALCTIGCGADANPPRYGYGAQATERAEAEGKEIAAEVKRIVGSTMQPITNDLTSSFGYVRLSAEQPDITELKKRLKSARAQVRRHAENMLAIHQRTGQIPEAYEAPIQVWRFGDQLAMVFLSGEVVVDYSLRLKRELAPCNAWISAYANDLFAYLASERVRREGGYEVDQSMIYYNQPGPWVEGTEETVVRRVHELLRGTSK